MKTNAIIRIIIWSIVIFLLLCTLGSSLLYRQYRMESVLAATEVPADYDLVEAPDQYQAFDATSIHDLDIQWAAGKIIILSDPDVDGIYVREAEPLEEKYRMECTQKGDTLTIAFCKDIRSGLGFSIGKEVYKDLTIHVPTDWHCDSLEIDAAASNLEVYSLTIGEVDFDGASGVCEFADCQVGSLDVDTASGDIHFSGNLKELDMDAASASFYGKLETTPERVDLDSMSGNLELRLPEDAGFTVRIDGMSSKFRSDFTTTARNGSYICGDGRCLIQVDAMSGDVTILKLN